jgi:hypothetical protein
MWFMSMMVIRMTWRCLKPGVDMEILGMIHPVAAIGFSILYLLFGGGLGGAVLIFVLAKMLGQ